MGKVKKLRQKYHLSLKKSKSLNNLSEVKDSTLELNPLASTEENIFAGINISFDNLNKSLPKDFDVRSVVSTKSRKELKEEERHLKKREKKKLRRERFMQKLDLTHQLLKASKSKKKTPKKNVSEDMKALLDALPSLESLKADKLWEKGDTSKGKRKGILKAKQRLKQQSLDVKLFKQILNDKTFKGNPLETINQYLKQKVQESS